MTGLYKTYRPTIIFIFKFLLIYLLLVVLYNMYLRQYAGDTDPVTRWVGQVVTKIYHYLGLQVQTVPIGHEPGLKLLINGQYVARIIEGCTAASVIILFGAFVISFGQSLKKSLVFAVVGSLLIFGFNLLRIVFLGYLLFAWPQYQELAHRVIFPAIIYGFVVWLWLIFVKKYNE